MPFSMYHTDIFCKSDTKKNVCRYDYPKGKMRLYDCTTDLELSLFARLPGEFFFILSNSSRILNLRKVGSKHTTPKTIYLVPKSSQWNTIFLLEFGRKGGFFSSCRFTSSHTSSFTFLMFI